jgi:hypothetical protein
MLNLLLVPVLVWRRANRRTPRVVGRPRKLYVDLWHCYTARFTPFFVVVVGAPRYTRPQELRTITLKHYNKVIVNWFDLPEVAIFLGSTLRRLAVAPPPSVVVTVLGSHGSYFNLLVYLYDFRNWWAVVAGSSLM